MREREERKGGRKRKEREPGAPQDGPFSFCLLLLKEQMFVLNAKLHFGLMLQKKKKVSHDKKKGAIFFSITPLIFLLKCIDT